jgi:hypothetical protein
MPEGSHAPGASVGDKSLVQIAKSLIEPLRRKTPTVWVERVSNFIRFIEIKLRNIRREDLILFNT